MINRLMALALMLGCFIFVSVWPKEGRAQAPDKEFTLFIGQTLTFNARGINKVTVGMDAIASVKPTSDNSQLVLTGRKVGTTIVNFFSRGERKTLLVRVVPNDPVSLSQEARELLGKRSGVDVRVVKGRVLLEGEVAGEVYKKKIEQLVALYPEQVLNFTTYREAFVEGARMVAVDLYFIQLAESGVDKLGIKWGQFIGANYTFGMGDVPLFYSSDSSGGGGGGGQGSSGAIGTGIMPGEQNPSRLPKAATLTGGSGGQYWSLIGNVTAAIDLMATYGLIKEIKHATVVTEGGTQADYHSGGTLLIKVESGMGNSNVVEKAYGMDLGLTPVLDFENRVKVAFNLNISELDYSNAVGEIPALRNSSVKGTVNMQEGQSVLIATQQSMLDTENKTGLAFLSKIPIAGLLFSARNKSTSELNNAIFITPRVYEPGGQTHKTLIEGAFERILDAGADSEDLPVLYNTQKPRSNYKPSKQTAQPDEETPEAGNEE